MKKIILPTFSYSIFERVSQIQAIKTFFLLLGMCISGNFLYAQTTCATAVQICSGISQDAQTAAGNAEAGPNYGCLSTVPRPSWFYVKVATSGTLSFNISIAPAADIDFIVWGPFTGPTCGSSLTSGNTKACNYTNANGGTANIGSVISGEYYMIMVTNFAGAAGVISISTGVSTATLSCVTPGGVTIPSLWYKADEGVTTGSTLTWSDKSGNGRNAVQATATNQPTLNSNLINFNPALVFDGTDNYLTIQNTAGLPTSTNQVEAFGVSRNLNTGGGISHLISYGGAASNSYFTLGKQSLTANAIAGFNGGDAASTALEYTSGATVLSNGKYTGTTGVISTFGKQRTTSTFIGAKATTNGKVGVDPSTTLSTCWNGSIAEAVLFSTNLSPTQVSQVNSYLAIKYGMTLDQSPAQNYLASDGTTIYWNGTSNSSYKDNITGIARDDASGLSQKQSRSVNTGLQVVMGNGNTIATDNDSNSNTFSADRSALMWGDNAGSVAAWSASGAPSLRQIIARKWKVQETGTVGSVKVQVADNSGSNGLPVETTTVYLLTDADGDFTSGATETAMTLNGTNWEANYNFTSGQYFTFATSNNSAVTLTLSMTVNNATVVSGGTLQYVLTLNNSGATTATNVQVKDQLPSGVTFNSATPSTGSFNPGTGIWTIPVVAPGISTLTLNVTAQ